MSTGQLGYTIAEAVKATGIGRTTIYADLKAGRLAARKRGKRTIILAEDLKSYLASLPLKQAASRHGSLAFAATIKDMKGLLHNG